MLASLSTLPLYEVVEFLGLLAALSGLLVLGSAVLIRFVFQTAQRRGPHSPSRIEATWPDSDSFFWPTMRKQGVHYLAAGGAMMTLAEIVEIMI